MRYHWFFLALVMVAIHLVNALVVKIALGVWVVLFLGLRFHHRRLLVFVVLFMTVMVFHAQRQPPESIAAELRVREINGQEILVSQGYSRYIFYTEQPMMVGDSFYITGKIVQPADSINEGTKPSQRLSVLGVRGIIEVETLEFTKHIESWQAMIYRRVQKLADPALNMMIYSQVSEAYQRDSSMALFLSSSLQFSSILWLFRTILGFWIDHKILRRCEIGVCILLGFSLGYQFFLVRMLLRRILAEFPISRGDRDGIMILGMLWCAPHGLLHPAFLLPLGFMLITHLKSKSSQLIARLLLLNHVLYTINLATLFFFPLFSFFIALTVLFAWLSLVNPALLIILNHFLDFCVWLLKLSEPWIVSGRLPLLISCGLVFLLFASWPARVKWILAWALLCLNFYGYRSLWIAVRVINVGQGDAILFQSQNETVLMDTGKPSAYYNLQQSLRAFGVKTIDVLIITHPDADHNGNQERLIAEYHIPTLITSKQDQYAFKVFKFQSLLQDRIYEDENQNSLIMAIMIEQWSFLFTGDITQRQESDLLEMYPGLKVDILKLAHHGSNTATSRSFISRIQPTFALISAQYRVYHHPADEVMRTLKAYGVKPIQTQMSGTISFVFMQSMTFITTSRGEFAIIAKR